MMKYLEKYISTCRAVLKDVREITDSFLSHGPNNYTHPARFLFFTLLVVLILQWITSGHWVPEFQTSPANEADITEEMSQFISNYRTLWRSVLFPAAIGSLLVPSLVISGLIFLRQTAESVYQQVLLSSYTTGITLLFLLLMLPVYLFFHPSDIDSTVLQGVQMALIILVILRVYHQFVLPDSGLDWIRLLSAVTFACVIYELLFSFLSGLFGTLIYLGIKVLEAL